MAWRENVDLAYYGISVVSMAGCPVDFDWDPQKDRENRRKHGFALSAGKTVFQDPNRLDEYDDRDYGEERWVAIGQLGPVIGYVVYTYRDGVRRLISVRKATADEQIRYFKRWP